jgi:hypothetical protein
MIPVNLRAARLDTAHGDLVAAIREALDGGPQPGSRVTKGWMKEYIAEIRDGKTKGVARRVINP